MQEGAPRDPYLEDLARVRDRIKADRARYGGQVERHPRGSRVLRLIARVLHAVRPR